MSFSFGQLHFSASTLIFMIGILALIAMTWLCVTAARRSLRPKRTGLLEVLRFLCALTVVLMLWQPEWRTTIEPTQDPEIVVLRDASGSMTTVDAPSGRIFSPNGEIVAREDVAKEIVDSKMLDALTQDERTKVIYTTFDTPPESDDPAVLSLAGTDLNSALTKVIEDHSNLRALVLLSDGDWNKGQSPLAAAQRLSQNDIPLFPVILGSESALPDLNLKKVSAPTYGIVGENIQIPFTIVSSLKRDVRTIVRLRDDNGNERTKDITIPAQSTHYDAIFWRLEKEGASTLTLSIPMTNGELVEKNNSQQFNIAGRPESIKALVIETNPRWEYRFIRNALSRDPGVEVDCLLLHPQLGRGDGPDYIQEFPENLEDLQKYDVVFLGDVGIGPDQLTEKQADLLKGLVENQASGIVFIPGRQGNQFSLIDTELGDLIPVTLDEKQQQGITESTPSPLSLTTEGRGSLLTMLGDTEEENPLIWQSLPGFYWHAPVLNAKSGTEVLAVHANRRNKNFGRVPLLVTSRAGNGKVLFLGMDAAWRWRRGVEDLYHYRFWGQVARWMSYQRNMAAGERVRLYFTPERPIPGDIVTLNANGFEKNGAPLKEGSVMIDLIAPDNTTQRFDLTRSEESWGAFTGRFKVTMPGIWKITARTTDSAEGATETNIIAQGTQLEKTGLPAKAHVLDELARITGGKMVTVDQLVDLLAEIKTLPEAQAQIISRPLWSDWRLATALITLLALFWIGRKLNGTF